MDQVLFNNILAVIGAITGLSGLIISLYLLNKEKVKFEVYHPTYEEDSSIAAFNETYIGRGDYGDAIYSYTPYLILVWLQITNKSKSRTTIIEMSLKIPNYDESTLYSRTSNKYIIASTYSKDVDGNIIIKSSWQGKETIIFPIAIEPFSAIEGYFCFRNLNMFTEKPIAAVLKIKTPQGTFRHKVTIKPSYPTLIEQ